MSATDTDKGDLRSQGVRAEGADVVATGTSAERVSPASQNDWRSVPPRIVWVLVGIKHGRDHGSEDHQEVVGVYESSAVAQAVVELVADEFDDLAWNPYPVVSVAQVAEMGGPDPSKSGSSSHAEPESAERSPDPRRRT